MEKIKERFNKYGLAEWIVLILGTIALSTQVYRYAVNTLEGSWLDIGVFAASILCLFAPKSLVNIVKTGTSKKI